MPWLTAEIQVIQPEVILCLGAIASKALVNKGFRVHQERGKWFKQSATLRVLATFHPSAILRSLDEKVRHEMKALFLRDLKKATLAINKTLKF